MHFSRGRILAQKRKPTLWRAVLHDASEKRKQQGPSCQCGAGDEKHMMAYLF